MGKANENKLSSTKLLNEFFKAFVELFEEEINILYVKTSNYFNSATKGILKDVPHVEVQQINNAGSNKFDILIGDFAFGASRFRKELPSEIIETLKSLISISSSGFGFFIFPSYERTFRYYDLNTHLKCEGFFVNGIINLPKNFLESNIMRPILVALSKTETSEIFIAELDDWEQGNYWYQCEAIASALINHVRISKIPLEELVGIGLVEKLGKEDEAWMNQGLDPPSIAEVNEGLDDHLNLFDGVIIPKNNFNGFETFKLNKKLNQYTQTLKGYERCKLKDITTEINVSSRLSKLNWPFNENSIYLPKSDHFNVTSSIASVEANPLRYDQIIVDPTKVLPEFLVNFLNNDIGKTILKYERSKRGSITAVRSLSKKEIENLEIAIPTIEAQKKIVDTLVKLEDVTVNIDKIRKNISINPLSADEDFNKVDQLLAASNDLSEQDKIKSEIAEGESKQLEFKSTLSLNTEEPNKKAKNLEETAFKAIVAFLNSKGGTLYIGVRDDKTIGGLEAELKQFYGNNTDKFLLNFASLFRKFIGKDKVSFVDPEIKTIDGKKVFRVAVQASPQPVFLDGKHFYARTNPASELIEGPELVNYINNHPGFAKSPI